MRLLAPTLVTLAAATTACGLIPTEIPVPIPLNSPSVDVDVGAGVDDAVASVCADEEDAACKSIALICRAETGADCDPIDLPDQFPREIEVEEGDVRDVLDLLPDELKDAAQLKFAIPADLTDALAGEGVSDPSQVKSIAFEQVFITWEENSLTFDAPVLDVFVGPFAEDVTDPDGLLASGDFTKVGTIGRDLDEATPGFEIGQVAGETGQVPLSFIEGGNAAFNDALRALSFTLVLALPDGQTLSLKEVEGTSPVKVRKPDGAAKLKLESILTYTVDLAAAATDAGGAVDDATE
jgi:hypothetical protein